MLHLHTSSTTFDLPTLDIEALDVGMFDDAERDMLEQQHLQRCSQYSGGSDQYCATKWYSYFVWSADKLSNALALGTIMSHCSLLGCMDLRSVSLQGVGVSSLVVCVLVGASRVVAYGMDINLSALHIAHPHCGW